MDGGHCRRIVAVGAEEDNWQLRETAGKVEVGRTVPVGAGSRVRKEVVGMIGLVEDRYDSQEARWEEEGNSLHEPEGRSLEVVEKPSRPKLK